MHVTVKLTVSSGELVTVLDEDVETSRELEIALSVLKTAWALEKDIESFFEAKSQRTEG